MGSEVETALREHRCTLNKFFGVAYNLDVAFHVFVRPTTRMGDIGEFVLLGWPRRASPSRGPVRQGQKPKVEASTTETPSTLDCLG
jgi:hypothetical protein